MVTIQTYAESVAAGLAQSLLESRGIQAVLLGLTSSNMIGVGSDMEEGIRLQVFEEDAAEAQRILRDGEGVVPISDDFVPPPDEQ